MRRVYRAAWVLPIDAPPIRDGWVVIDGEHIVDVGQGAAPDLAEAAGALTDLGSAAVMPALTNAHTHLELSWLRGRVPPGNNFITWVTDQMRLRLSPGGQADDQAVRAAMRAALDEMTRSGTGVAGDISNSLAGLDLLECSGLAGVVFHEILKFDVTDADAFVARARERIDRSSGGPRWRLSLAPHAPYSVSPGTFEAIRAWREPGREIPTAVHVGESPEEMELLATGRGGWRTMLEHLCAWNPGWVAPGCGPVEYLDRLGFWDPRTLAVHGVQVSDRDLALLATRGATLVTCPRSNVYVGVGDPPAARFFASGVRVAVGTDSLASVPDLNLFSELAELRRLAPAVRPRDLLASATVNGAAALGLDDRFGTIAPGKRAALIAVAVPAGVPDVEQYLVSGISPEQVSWIAPPSC